MRDMDPVEARRFLERGNRTGKLAVVRADGSPMVVPVWFVLDEEGSLVFTTWADSLKGRVLRRNPRVSICVDEEVPPYAYVRVDGVATLSGDLEALRTWATRIARRYMGDDLAPAYGRRNGVEGELLVRVTPTRIVAKADVAD